MKIAYVAPYSSNFPSRDANSIHMMHMCEAFAKIGHDVSLVISSRGAKQADIFEHYGINLCFSIRQLSVPQIKGKKALYCHQALMGTCRLKPDMVVGRSVHVCALAALWGLPVIYDAHAPVWEKSNLDYLAFQILRRSKKLLRMTTNSSALKYLCIQAGQQPRTEIVVANNGSSEFPGDEFPPSWPGRDGAFQVGYMGHLYSGRGVEIIIACAEQLPEMDFHIVGGHDRDIEHWKSLTALPNLFFHGFVKHSEIHKYRNQCDVLLAPYMSRGVAMAGGSGDQSRYMNPIKIIEYMSTRKPIIASDLPVLREVLADGRNALLCDPEDVSAWCYALKRLAEDAKLADRLARAAYGDFIQNYTWQARARRLIGERVLHV
ncbi:MAG: glycosyltransferase family 4 protein [Desulfosalsimonas sp.]